MKRRWRALVLLFVLAALGVSATLWILAIRDESWRNVLVRHTYTDLETALAPMAASGWELSVPPKLSGPYRLLSEGGMIGNSEDAGLGGVLHDPSGNLVEEIKLRGLADYDQTIVYLETADGQRTLSAMKRVHLREIEKSDKK